MFHIAINPNYLIWHFCYERRAIFPTFVSGT